MSSEWQLTFKPSFLNELNALDKLDVAQITRKLDVLAHDPTPDAKVKKQLKNMGGKLHRLRAGGFRILYTFKTPFVSLLSVRKRDESTYDDEPDVETFGGPEDDATPVHEAPEKPRAWEVFLAPAAPRERQLPRAIDAALLDTLGVPEAFRAPLLAVGTEEALTDCPVPQDILFKVMDAVLGRPVEEVAKQPDLLLDSANDLLRFKEGDLLGFLLRLEPEQEKLVAWGVKSDHPTLLKGGPGTGKSTVALYRVRAMIEALRKKGVEHPRILFTTYTRALTRVSEQLLVRLLGKDASLVDVRTADAIVREIDAGEDVPFATEQDILSASRAAMDSARLEGNALVVAAGRETLQKLGPAYVADEIRRVIEARGIDSLDGYLGASRVGRKRSLNKAQRTAVFRAYEAFRDELARRRKTTFEALRRRARDKVRSGAVKARYDGVVIDEVQDLPPTTVAAVVGLAKTRGGIFLTADANQSIYGSAFRWKDVHEDLSFQGATAILRSNHRTTREIGEAARAYLDASGEDGAIDEEKVAPAYVHDGALPAVRAVENAEDEAKLVARFIRAATREMRLGLGAAAVLVPTNDAAANIASDLRALGIDAERVEPRDLDLTAPGVKVITQRSAKGLEFPIVALAGFDRAGPPADAEGLAETRRAVYVAMTRAMRALLVVVPAGHRSTVLTGFDDARWNRE